MVCLPLLPIPILEGQCLPVVAPSALILASKQGTYLSNLSRVPKDKRIVMDPIREKEIWWGDVNRPLESSSFQILEDTAINYFNTRSRVPFIGEFSSMFWMVMLDGKRTSASRFEWFALVPTTLCSCITCSFDRPSKSWRQISMPELTTTSSTLESSTLIRTSRASQISHRSR